MKPGRELDALVAEKVMGWTGEEEEGFWPNSEWVWRDKMGHRIHAPSEFSTDIAAAWQVVERMRLLIEADNDVWGAFIEALNEQYSYAISKLMGDLTPHAICLAALRAVGVEL